MQLFAHIDAATRNAQLEDAAHESVDKLADLLVKSLARTGELSQP